MTKNLHLLPQENTKNAMLIKSLYIYLTKHEGYKYCNLNFFPKEKYAHLFLRHRNFWYSSRKNDVMCTMYLLDVLPWISVLGYEFYYILKQKPY